MSFAGAWDPIKGSYAKALLLALVAPAVLVACAIVVVLDPGGPGLDLASQAIFFIYAMLLAVMVIAPATFLIGLPLTLLLHRWRLERVWVYPVAGALAGAAIVTFVPALFDGRGGDPVGLEFLPFSPIGAVPGALSGTIWWWGHRRHVQTYGDAHG